MKPTVITVFIVLFLMPPAAAEATTLTFENVAPANAVLNVNPAAPYTEEGFTVSVTNPLAAIVDSGNPNFDMPGNLTDFFGFSGSNTPALTFAGGAFDLVSLLIGPTTIGVSPNTITLTATLIGGGTLTSTFGGLTTATEVTPNWSGLESVSFTALSDAGLDNIVVNASAQVPESGSAILLALGLMGLSPFWPRRRCGREQPPVM